MVNSPSVRPIKDFSLERLHDSDPIGYHTKLASVHVSCGYCERRRPENSMVLDARFVKRETQQ